jgi:dTDP-4-amino-4,6-dideoxygalactose transaminase
MQVPYTFLDRQYQNHRAEILDTVDDIFSRSAFILRPEVALFESRIASLLNVEDVIGVNSGTDALYLGVRALDLPAGSEVITVAHTFVASVSAIIHAGLKPVLVDISERDFNIDVNAIEAAITPATRAILVVHMNGRACDMAAINAIADQHGLLILEDAAQAIGARYGGAPAGSFGKFAAFSLHPMKILGGAGDGGFIATSDRELGSKFRAMRNLGQSVKGVYGSHAFNSRLDTLQAAICLVKLRHLDNWIDRRRQLAARYDAILADQNSFVRPLAPSKDTHFDVYSSYVIRSHSRDALSAHLAERGVETMMAWSPPLHYQPGLNLDQHSLPVTELVSREVLSLPIGSEMTDDESDYVLESLRSFAG